jgi:hypothetical protein
MESIFYFASRVKSNSKSGRGALPQDGFFFNYYLLSLRAQVVQGFRSKVRWLAMQVWMTSGLAALIVGLQKEVIGNVRKGVIR